MPVPPPRRHLLAHGALTAPEVGQPGGRLVDELAEGGGQVATLIALAATPLVLLGLAVRAVAGQGQDF